MFSHLTPLYLSSLIPPSASDMSRYNLRNSDQLQTIDSRTNLYYNSFLPSTVRAWNSLPAEVKQSQTTHSFKYYFNKNKTPVSKYYYSKNRKAQILHTRLRTNCSSLNLDLFLKGITDSPMCRCGSIENSQHFFFHCPYYHTKATNYRPIALTSCLCKTVERMINDRLVWFLESNQLITKYQAGFRKNNCTNDHLIRLESFIRDAFVKKEHVVAVFFDLEKAYDTTWKYGIMKDLHKLGLKGRLPLFIQNFLSDRTYMFE